MDLYYEKVTLKPRRSNTHFIPSYALSPPLQVLGPEGALSEGGQGWLHKIGRLLAVDIVINNSDRLPAVWSAPLLHLSWIVKPESLTSILNFGPCYLCTYQGGLFLKN